MNEERLLKVLVSPHISEKSVSVGDSNNQVVFKVLKDATKPEIKAAVEKMFEVQVENVAVVNKKGKTKGTTGRNAGRRPSFKKAYVSLKEGSQIDFMGMAE
ncbi:MAG: 50S ribosomal protein L23 [Gammaproteobacteria bacterium]|nr:50S ribosomal protein L23 [Gammaproteobacteria bacterium]